MWATAFGLPLTHQWSLSQRERYTGLAVHTHALVCVVDIRGLRLTNDCIHRALGSANHFV